MSQMTPRDLPGKAVNLKDLSRLLRELPELGTEAAALGKDLYHISQEQPPLPSVLLIAEGVGATVPKESS
ncbi:MAG: hypothetical protein L7F78_14255 [Syntrophales bacterium LBB04]|nr:hypothetical protein [Syntrophales bacterium LBB04]